MALHFSVSDSSGLEFDNQLWLPKAKRGFIQAAWRWLGPEANATWDTRPWLVCVWTGPISRRPPFKIKLGGTLFAEGSQRNSGEYIKSARSLVWAYIQLFTKRFQVGWSFELRYDHMLIRFRWSAKPRLPLCLISTLQNHQPRCNIEIKFRKDLDYTFFSICPPADISVKSIQQLHNLKGLRALAITILQDKTNHFVELLKAVSGLPLRSLVIHALGQEKAGIDPHPLVKCPWTQKQQLVGFSSLTRLELVSFCLCKDLETEIDWLNTFLGRSLLTFLLPAGPFSSFRPLGNACHIFSRWVFPLNHQLDMDRAVVEALIGLLSSNSLWVVANYRDWNW